MLVDRSTLGILELALALALKVCRESSCSLTPLVSLGFLLRLRVANRNRVSTPFLSVTLLSEGPGCTRGVSPAGGLR